MKQPPPAWSIVAVGAPPPPDAPPPCFSGPGGTWAVDGFGLVVFGRWLVLGDQLIKKILTCTAHGSPPPAGRSWWPRHAIHA